MYKYMKRKFYFFTEFSLFVAITSWYMFPVNSGNVGITWDKWKKCHLLKLLITKNNALDNSQITKCHVLFLFRLFLFCCGGGVAG